MKCPHCLFDNPSETLYCAKCGTKLLAAEEAALSPTMTLQYPANELSRGSTIGGRLEIIERLGRGGIPRVAISGRNVIQLICRQDKKRFVTSI
jgi:hypothetical protein